MNAIKLYVSAARLVLENDHYDYSVCKEINNVFPCLEQSLTCTVCRNILSEPYSPTETTCQHHVCKTCVGGRKRLRPSCSWCKDYAKYVRNTQLQCLLACYKGLCDYIKCTSLLTQMNDFCTQASNDKTIMNMVQKGTELLIGSKEVKVNPKFSQTSDNTSELSNDFHYRVIPKRGSSNVQQNHIHDNNVSSGNESPYEQHFIEVPRIKIEPGLNEVLPPRHKSLGTDTKMETHPPRLRSATDDTNASSADKLSDSTSEELNPKTLYSVSFSGTRSKLILKRRHVTPRREVKKERGYFVKQSNHVEELPVSHALRTTAYPSQQSCVSTNELSRFRKSKSKQTNSTGRPNCRCGNATPRPGKLTCCGQRCACYMQSKACTGCRCRGCRNPHMIDGVKVLGRFTKDDHDPPEPNLVIGSASSFQDLSASFLNQQVNQVLPNMCSGSVLNIS